MPYDGPPAGVINIIPRTSSGSGVYVPVAPSSDIGGDGDFAFDQNTNTLYGPKDSTQTNPWPVSGLSIGNGRYTWRGAWSSANSYNAGDIVHYNAEQFVCIKTLDYGSPVAWTAQAYTAGSYVTYSSVLHVAVVDAVSGDVPGTATSVWKEASPDIDSANYGFAAQGNFLRLSSSIQAETSISMSPGTVRLTVAKNSLLYGAYPIAPKGIQTGSTFPNYIVDSQAVDSSSSLELSTTSFLTPDWNSGGGGATVEVKASGVTTAKIADRNVTNIKLANTSGSEAVSTGVIRDSAVTTAKLADSSVTSAKIASGTIITADIANGAITQPLLGTEAVGEGNISPYLTTGTSSPSAYVASSKLVSANTTVSGTSISTTNAAVDAQALRNGLNGWSVPNGQPLPNVSRSAASNSVYLARFYAPTAITASKISVYVTSQSATSTDWFDIGIFSTAGTLLASTGQTTGINATGTIIATLGAGTGAKTGSANYALTAGTTYYIGIMTSLASGTVSYSGIGGFSGSTLYGTANGQWMFDSRTATGTTTSINAATISWPTVTSIPTGSTVFFVLRTD